MEFFDKAVTLEKNGVRASEKRLPEIYKIFREAMDNDFNTPEVLTRMHALMHDSYKSNDTIAQLTTALAIGHFGAEVFGIVFGQNADTSALKPEIEREIGLRNIARKNKDFKTADEIRNRLLAERHVELRDLSDGRTTWRVKL